MIIVWQQFYCQDLFRCGRRAPNNLCYVYLEKLLVTIAELAGDAHVFPGFLTAALKQISFQSHRLRFSHASAEVRGENTPERNFASTGSRTHNNQVMSPTRSPLSHPGRARVGRNNR